MYKTTIYMIQRTALGTDRGGKTVIHGVADERDVVGWYVGRRPHSRGLRPIAEITIIHPSVMVGDQEEIHRAFLHAAREHALKGGAICVNKWGVEFAA